MDKLLEMQTTLPGILTTIAAVMVFHLFFRVAEFVWEFAKKKSELSEQAVEKLTVALSINTSALSKLEIRLNEIEKNLGEIPKFKKDLSKLFLAVKSLAGAQWSEIRKEFDDL